MDEPLVSVAGFLLAFVALDLAALRYGHDSRSGAREMPGVGDAAPIMTLPGRGLVDTPRRMRSVRRGTTTVDLKGADLPPLHGVLRLRPPVSAEGHVRLDLAALGK